MRKVLMQGYKVFTHDLCSPVQGGPPVWDGTLPSELPEVKLDRRQNECGGGMEFWTNKLTVASEVSEDQIRKAIHDFSSAFKNHRKHMVESQIAWRHALSRPSFNPGKIEEGLRETLDVRGLASWQLKHFDNARDAWDAWAALTLEFASLNKWIKDDPDYLTRGLRDAYENGLEVAIPTGPNEFQRIVDANPARGEEMKYQALLEAITEAERFLGRARELENNESDKRQKNKQIGPYLTYDSMGKLAAATKRASMDLTRALAELRKP